MKEAYCSYEISKLLKEKGFDWLTYAFYIPYEDGDVKFIISKYKEKYNTLTDYPWLISAPTHQLAMRWLREIYDLHIIAYPFKSGNDTSTKHYCCQVFKTFNLLGHEKYTNETLASYEEAVETAIKYCLEELIK